jgi:hypothetical protein
MNTKKESDEMKRPAWIVGLNSCAEVLKKLIWEEWAASRCCWISIKSELIGRKKEEEDEEEEEEEEEWKTSQG